MNTPDTPDTSEMTDTQAATDKQGSKKADSSVILTRTNIILFVVVVAMGAIILAQLCIVTLLLTSPNLRERIYGAPAPAPTRSIPRPAPERSDTVWFPGEPDGYLFLPTIPDTWFLKGYYAT